MNKKMVLITLLLVLGISIWQPMLSQNIDRKAWNILFDVSFEPQYLQEYGEMYLVPEFGSAPKAAEGKTFEITGYIIPADPEEDIYILSMYPFSSCFFCGSAGPETIVELVFEDKDNGRKKNYKIDDVRTFRGILKLNQYDVAHTNYILRQAEEVK